MWFARCTQKRNETCKKRYSCLDNLFWHWADQPREKFRLTRRFYGFYHKKQWKCFPGRLVAKALRVCMERRSVLHVCSYHMHSFIHSLIHSFIEGMCRKGFPGKLMLQQRTHRTLGEWRTIVLQPLVWGANRPGSSPLKNFKLPKSSKPQIRPKLFHLLLKTPFEGLRKSSTVPQIAMRGIAVWC